MTARPVPVREKVRERRTSLLPLLLQVHEAEGYLSPESITRLSRQLRISENEIYGVATFHPQFRFRPPGKYRIQVCLGNSCHVGGGQNFTEAMKIHKGIGEGETTADGTFSLEGVACVGCCAMAPVVVVNGEVHGRMNRVTFMRLIESLAPSREGTEPSPAPAAGKSRDGAGPDAGPKM
ncbi:MAG: NAD(P)H-dependent oxidoreductase subunit E [Candidatus Aminicenantes bacterium]|nr:NAD(P)H-dependent oxidoreductase subunit E [Candidatus Aminicenantes bacterium]